MSQGLLKTCQIAESVAFLATSNDAIPMRTSVAIDTFIEDQLVHLFKKARPMACETQSLFTQLTLKEHAIESVAAMTKAGLKLTKGLLFAAKLEFENGSHGYLLLRTNREIETIDNECQYFVASDFQKGLLALLVHVEVSQDGEITETCYTKDSLNKRGCNDWNLFLNLVPIVDDYAMTTDLVVKLSKIVHESHNLNGLQRLQLQQICWIELCNQANGEFSIADMLRRIYGSGVFRNLDLNLLSDLGLFMVDAKAISDCKKLLSAKLKLSNGMIVSYDKHETPTIINNGYGRYVNDNLFEVIFGSEIFE